MRHLLVLGALLCASLAAYADDAPSSAGQECTPLADLRSDSQADGDGIRNPSKDELAVLWALAVDAQGWDAWAIGHPAIIISHVNPKRKDSKEPEVKWVAAFIDGTKVCDTLPLTEDNVRVLARMYVEDHTDSR